MCIWFVAYNYWVYIACFDVINVCVNRVSTILNLTHSAINGLHCPILPKWMYRLALLRKMQMTRLLPHPKNEHQRSVNEFWHCVMKYPVGCAVIVRQWFLSLHLGNCMGCAATLRHNRAIGRLSRQNLLQQHRYYVLKMRVNGPSTTLGLVSWKILVLCGDNRP
jgi:hypothetical protein